jgi:hypothetical protein
MPKLREFHGSAPGRQVGLKLHQLPPAEIHAELAQVFVHAQLPIPVSEVSDFRQKSKPILKNDLGNGDYNKGT